MNENTPVDSTLYGIAQAISRIEQQQKDFKTELLGNGQKGRIQRIEDDIDDLTQRVSNHEKKMSWYNGVFVVIGAMFHFIAHKLGL